MALIDLLAQRLIDLLLIHLSFLIMFQRQCQREGPLIEVPRLSPRRALRLRRERIMMIISIGLQPCQHPAPQAGH